MTLAIVWAGCVTIAALSAWADAFIHLRALAILGLGAGIVGGLPLLLIMTPSVYWPPYIWAAGIFSFALILLSQIVLSLFLDRPFFGSFVIGAGVAILLALFCVWLGRALWRAIRS